MKLHYRADQVHNPLQILRHAGYQHFVDPVTKKESYILRLTAAFYPRFHLYLQQEDGEITFDLHLDQKKPSYSGSNAHGGEYEGPNIEKEMNRIAGWINHAAGAPIAPITPTAPQNTHSESNDTKNNSKPDIFRGIFG